MARWFFPAFVHPCRTDATPIFIRNEHRRGRRVNVWTVNDPEVMRRMAGWGVDGIISDETELLVQTFG